MQIGMALSICVISSVSLKSGFRMGFQGWDIFQVFFSTEKHHCGGICPPIGLHSSSETHPKDKVLGIEMGNTCVNIT